MVDTVVAINGETVASTATVDSEWIDCSDTFLLGVYTVGASATGTISVDTSVWLSPLSASAVQALDDAGTLAATDYVKTKLSSSALASDGALTFYAVAQATYGPFKSMKVDVTGDGSNPADSVCTCYVCKMTY
jgi:hypothetical protein